jgi:hypothetical protein
MQVPNDKILNFLTEVEDVSIGYHEIVFFNADNLEEEQIGYAVDAQGQSLSTGEDGDWQEEWLVIGNDDLGDPIFIDTTDTKYPVYTAIHGEGDCEPILIADSLNHFSSTLKSLKKLSLGREYPKDFEQNPITKAERKQFASEIKSSNGKIGVEWWMSYLDEDDDDEAKEGIFSNIAGFFKKLFG